MLTLIITDNSALGVRVRTVINRCGHECPQGYVVSPSWAMPTIVANRQPELIVVIARERLDASSVDEVHAATSAKLVIIGPTRDPEQLLEALRAGADDYVDIEGPLEADLGRVLNRLKSRRNARPPGQLITATAANGGTGLSTLVTNLSVVLAQQHKRCGVVEMQAYRSDLAPLLNLKPRHSLADLCGNMKDLDEEMLETSMAVHEAGVHLLSGPAFSAPEHPNFPVAIDRIVNCARALFPVTVLELDDCWRNSYVDILRQSNVILLCCRLDFVAIRNARRAVDHFQRIGVREQNVRLVASYVGQSSELPLRKAENVLGTKMTCCLPNEPKTVNASTNLGVPVVVESPRSRFAKSLCALASQLGDSEFPNADTNQAAGGESSQNRVRALVEKCTSWAVLH